MSTDAGCKPPAASVAPPRPVPAASPLLGANAEFVAIEIPAPLNRTAGAAAQADAELSADPLIHVELRRGPLHLSVRWPTSAAHDCTA